jgi:hypothetical protein
MALGKGPYQLLLVRAPAKASVWVSWLSLATASVLVLAKDLVAGRDACLAQASASSLVLAQDLWLAQVSASSSSTLVQDRWLARASASSSSALVPDDWLAQALASLLARVQDLSLAHASGQVRERLWAQGSASWSTPQAPDL